MADYSREEIQDLISTNVKVVLKGKDLSKLNLRGEELSDSELDGSNLNAINMANITKANFSSANMTGINLDNANLSDALISPVKVNIQPSDRVFSSN